MLAQMVAVSASIPVAPVTLCFLATGVLAILRLWRQLASFGVVSVHFWRTGVFIVETARYLDLIRTHCESWFR